jgi:hypothetical protein
MLNPAKKNVNGQGQDGSATDPLGLPFPEKAGDEREKDDAREDEVYNENKIPCISMFKKR